MKYIRSSHITRWNVQCRKFGPHHRHTRKADYAWYRNPTPPAMYTSNSEISDLPTSSPFFSHVKNINYCTSPCLLYWNLHFKLVLNVCVRRIRNQNSCFSESFTCISSYHSPTTIICKSLLFAFHGSVAPPQSSLKNPAFAFHGIIAPPKPSRFEGIFWVPFLRYEESGKCCCFFLGGGSKNGSYVFFHQCKDLLAVFLPALELEVSWGESRGRQGSCGSIR